jgi:plasmid maintenance system killer protein
VIKSFKNALTEAAANGEVRKGFPADLIKVARRKLAYLDAATTLEDLRAPPANRRKLSKAIARASIRSGSMINTEFASSGLRKGQRTLNL